jgi:hypothetical protein
MYWTVSTACPAGLDCLPKQELLSCELMAFPAVFKK